MQEDFDIERLIDDQTATVKQEAVSGNEMEQFVFICSELRSKLDDIDSTELQEVEALERQRKALLGEPREVAFYRNRIQDILNERGYRKAWYPGWYNSLDEAVYNELLGYAGITDWIQSKGTLKSSSSCKIIGDHIYYMIDGELVLQKQQISKERRDLLKSTLLLSDPKKNRAAAYHEVYLYNGTRVTIYTDAGMTKENQDCIVFRKYFVNVYTFEEQSARHTIPNEAIPLFKVMVKLGYNVAFTGPVRSAKTTFLTTWQSYEDPRLEGLMIETDPEIPLHLLMPTAPIMQLVPSEAYMDTVISTAKRSDARYVILGEARNGKMLNIAIEAANMGTLRSKVTFHNTETVDFTYDVAEKVTRDCGGDLFSYMIKTAKSFHYVLNFFSLPQDESQKRLKGLWEVRYNQDQMDITMHQICRYRVFENDWVWANDIGTDKIQIGQEQDRQALQEFQSILASLAEKYPNQEKHIFRPPYLKVLRRGG